MDANRSELGLATPVSQVIHDQNSGVGGFLSLMYNATPKDQLRWIVSLRENHYQIPNTQDQQDAGIRDLDLERDYLAGFYWMHTFSDGVLFTVSPYFHFNDAHYVGGPQDTPFILDDNNRSNYFGVRPVLQVQKGKHNARIGVDVWGAARQQLLRPDWQSGWRIARSSNGALGEFECALSGGSVSADFVADAGSWDCG